MRGKFNRLEWLITMLMCSDKISVHICRKPLECNKLLLSFEACSSLIFIYQLFFISSAKKTYFLKILQSLRLLNLVSAMLAWSVDKLQIVGSGAWPFFGWLVFFTLWQHVSNQFEDLDFRDSKELWGYWFQWVWDFVYTETLIPWEVTSLA